MSDIALGLTHFGTPPRRFMQAGIPPNTILWECEAIEVFGRKHNAATFRHWVREGLSQPDPRFALQQAFKEAVANAGNIHFNLDGFDVGKAWRLGQYGDPYTAGVTNWEFVNLLKDANLRARTIFWQNGKQVPLARVLERAGVPPNVLP